MEAEQIEPISNNKRKRLGGVRKAGRNGGGADLVVSCALLLNLLAISSAISSLDTIWLLSWRHGVRTPFSAILAPVRPSERDTYVYESVSLESRSRPPPTHRGRSRKRRRPAPSAHPPSKRPSHVRHSSNPRTRRTKHHRTLQHHKRNRLFRSRTTGSHL
jgi:hypothetical protein